MYCLVFYGIFIEIEMKDYRENDRNDYMHVLVDVSRDFHGTLDTTAALFTV